MFQVFHMHSMIGVKFTKRRLKVIFKLRCLRVFYKDATIETKGLVLRITWLLKVCPSSLFGWGSWVFQNLFEKRIFFDNLAFRSFSLSWPDRCSNDEIFLLIFEFISWFKESDTRCWNWTCSWGDGFSCLERIIEFLDLAVLGFKVKDSFSFQLTSHCLNITFFY